MSDAIREHDAGVSSFKNNALSFALITPARNEEANIERTIESVIAQTRRPDRWIIVSDGSTDKTDEIVCRYLAANPWIELIRMPEHADRQFAAKVHCFNAGFERIKEKNYGVIGNLDADTSFVADHFEYLLGQFEKDPTLGVAGSPFVEDGSQVYDYRYTNIEHVSGACQLFRIECFDAIGGYTPIPGGGIDWLAVTTARSKGWKTRTFTERTITHHRKMGTEQTGLWRAKVRLGQKDYNLGNHPIWELFRASYQSFRGKPFLIGGALILSGYTSAALNRKKRPIPQQVLDFARREQMWRIRAKARELLLGKSRVKDSL